MSTVLTSRRLVGGAWVVALLATSGSLYYSLGLGLFPCELCWYQRILMYPLVVVLGYAGLTGQRDVHRVGLPLSVPGLTLAAYHSYLQLTPGITCQFVGCATVQFRLFGVVTIPNQSLLAFTIVSGILGLTWYRYRRDE